MDNFFPTGSKISLKDRYTLMGQKPCVIWFTGLSGSGKSTIASLLELELFERKHKVYMLDGDNIRSGLNCDLTFSDEGRKENIRRIGEVSKIMSDAGLIVICAFISPFNSDRKEVKKIVGADKFIEVFVDCPIEVCEQRDIKGLYAKARKGEIKQFTGIDSPYEKPENPNIIIHSDLETIKSCLQKVLAFVENKIKL